MPSSVETTSTQKDINSKTSLHNCRVKTRRYKTYKWSKQSAGRHTWEPLFLP